MTTYSHTQPSVIIVGGGLSGLSAAAYLARAGHGVMLFEKSSTPGGRARTREQNGFFFNQGAHAFRLHGSGDQVMSELGVSYSSTPQSKPSGASMLADGKLYPMPVGAGFLLGTGFLTDAAEAELTRVLGLLKHLLRLLFTRRNCHRGFRCIMSLVFYFVLMWHVIVLFMLMFIVVIMAMLFRTCV
ncbi:hypothetical protein KSF_005720 [Reticulibacter mediterranei]|uniref:Amine oxidase domain-containing protein n=1 Tax=Reticulibacter mediterranei TaxID=2778369 RepID=A0A8J3I7Z3_9CHLR|nr:FAD-dependent oxidoreductase [Reticulibacter mediterranei]GHO90524.1 hypothetical protein KSF_005720 [Reticulibacter mediterranei]